MISESDFADRFGRTRRAAFEDSAYDRFAPRFISELPLTYLSFRVILSIARVSFLCLHLVNVAHLPPSWHTHRRRLFVRVAPRTRRRPFVRRCVLRPRSRVRRTLRGRSAFVVADRRRAESVCGLVGRVCVGR